MNGKVFDMGEWTALGCSIETLPRHRCPDGDPPNPPASATGHQLKFPARLKLQKAVNFLAAAKIPAPLI